MSRDAFSLLSEREQSIKAGARRTLGEHMGVILLIICLVLTAVLPLVVLELVNPFSEAFLLRTAYTALTSTLAYLLFIPEGKRAEWRQNTALLEARERASTLSSLVREGHLADFTLFCKSESERVLCERRAYLLSLAEGEKGGEGRLKRRARRLSVRAVTPSLVLYGNERSEPFAVGAERRGQGLLRALLRPIPVILSSLLFSSVVILPGAALDAATAVRILSGLFGVVTAAFAGFAAGGESARSELSRLEGRILFLSSFLEREGLAV